MVDYIRSDQPTLTITQDAPSESLRIQVVNPTPTGSRPTVVSNSIYRRTTGATGNWTLVTTVGNNGLAFDTFMRPATSIDYFVVTDTYAESFTYTATTPAVTGMWGYSTTNLSGTAQHFPYTDGGSESLDEVESVLSFVGRTYPVVESGIQETQTVAVNATIPFSDLDWRTQIEWWRLRKRDRATIQYRDGRGRVFASRIVGPVTIAPTRGGAQVTCTLQRVDYAASTIELDPAYYNAGAYNAGGNGGYTNGQNGNGL